MGEEPADAAERIHFEKTGIRIPAARWTAYARTDRHGGSCHNMYANSDEVEYCRTCKADLLDARVYVFGLTDLLNAAADTTSSDTRIRLRGVEHYISGDVIALLRIALRAKSYAPDIAVLD